MPSFTTVYITQFDDCVRKLMTASGSSAGTLE